MGTKTWLLETAKIESEIKSEVSELFLILKSGTLSPEEEEKLKKKIESYLEWLENHKSSGCNKRDSNGCK